MGKDTKNILLVYPEYLKTFWSFEQAMKIMGRKAAYPPLGLLTIASMLPKHWNKKLIDTNTEKLNNSDIAWADYVFISGMIVQKESALKIIDRVKQANKPIIAGGPLFTTGGKEFPMGKIDQLNDTVDHRVAKGNQGIEAAERQGINDLLNKYFHYKPEISLNWFCQQNFFRQKSDNICTSIPDVIVTGMPV